MNTIVSTAIQGLPCALSAQWRQGKIIYRVAPDGRAYQDYETHEEETARLAAERQAHSEALAAELAERAAMWGMS